MPPSLALLSALFLDNPILRFQMFGGVCNASLQRLTHLDQSLFLKFPATLGSDYCGHDPITLERQSDNSPNLPYEEETLPSPYAALGFGFQSKGGRESQARCQQIEQIPRVDKWSVCRGLAAMGRCSGLK